MRYMVTQTLLATTAKTPWPRSMRDILRAKIGPNLRDVTLQSTCELRYAATLYAAGRPEDTDGLSDIDKCAQQPASAVHNGTLDQLHFQHLAEPTDQLHACRCRTCMRFPELDLETKP